MANRYQELKKENDQTVSYLGDTYQYLADIYIKKARGYAVKNEDTEIKIRTVLDTLKNYDEQRIPLPVAIPNESKFIEENVKLLSKKYKDPDHIKGIIWLTVIIVFCIGWIVAGQYLARPVYFDAPTGLKVTKINDDKIKVSWREVDNAKEYVIYFKDETGNKSALRTISECEYIFEIDKSHSYTFYVYVKESSAINKSSESSITYTPE